MTVLSTWPGSSTPEGYFQSTEAGHSLYRGLAVPMSVTADCWNNVARLRALKGDTDGIRRARNNAKVYQKRRFEKESN